MLTCGRPFSSKLEVAPVTRSPPMIRSRSSQAPRSPERWSRNSNCFLVRARRVRARLEAELEVGGLAEDALGFGRVLHAGQLHHDAVAALLLDHRLGHAELVDAVAQRREVLVDRVVLHLLDLLRADREHEHELVAALLHEALELGHRVLDHAHRGGARRLVRERGLDAITPDGPDQPAHARLAQLVLEVRFVDRDPLGDGRIGIDLQQEVHAAAEVEAELERRAADRRQPRGRGRREVQRHHVVIAQRALDRRLRAQLVLDAGQPQQRGIGVELAADGLNLLLRRAPPAPCPAPAARSPARCSRPRSGSRDPADRGWAGSRWPRRPARTRPADSSRGDIDSACADRDPVRGYGDPGMCRGPKARDYSHEGGPQQMRGLSPARRARCGTGASSPRPRPSPADARSSAPCGTPAPGAAS